MFIDKVIDKKVFSEGDWKYYWVDDDCKWVVIQPHGKPFYTNGFLKQVRKSIQAMTKDNRVYYPEYEIDEQHKL